MIIKSKSGKEVEITNDRGNLVATIPSMNLDLGGVDLVEIGIKARFPTTVGGKPTRITVELEGEEFSKVKKMFAEVEADVAKLMAENEAYEARRVAIHKLMNP